jgi:hypothetical protein
MTCGYAESAMIAPFDWIDFVSSLPKDLKRGKTLEERLLEFRDGFAPNVRAELMAFFKNAAEAAKSDWSLYSPEIQETVYFSVKGKTSQQFYAEVLAVFQQSAS